MIITLKANNLAELSSHLIANPDNYMDSFRENVRMYVAAKEITLSDIADEADISESTLKSFLYGNSKDCNLSLAVKIARALNISVDELIGSGTIASQTCESLQLMRKLPESFTHFVRWAIHYHYDALNSYSDPKKVVEVMRAQCSDNGNLKMTNSLKVLDISHLSLDIIPKIFLGVQFPCSLYAPNYFENDIILLANDREARDGEHVLVGVNDNMWILSPKTENVGGKLTRNYYSIRDGKLCANESQIEIIIGYVVTVYRDKNPRG